MFTLLFRTVIVICAVAVTFATSYSQTVSVSPLSGNADFDSTPQSDGVMFIAETTGESVFLVTVHGDTPSVSIVTIGPHFSIVESTTTSAYLLSDALVSERDGVFAFAFVPVPAELKGTEFESQYANTWLASNSAWFSMRFGWDWQDALGELLAEHVLIPLVGVDNLANASDTTLVTGTVIVAIPTAIGIVAGGEIVLGVGTIGGGATAGGGAAAAGGGTAAAGGGAAAAGGGAAAAGGGAAVTGAGISNAAIMRAFFTGQTLVNNPGNVAALNWYLQVARNVLERYKDIGYTGPGVATQTERIRVILEQLKNWGH